MEYRTTDIRTGLFVAFSILAATVLIFLMGGIRGAFRDAQEIKFRFPNIRLLERESPVTIGGFRVGEVIDVARVETTGPDGKKQNEVEVTMAIDRSVRVCANASAMVRQDGFLGPKFVALDPGNGKTMHDGSTILAGTTEVTLSDLMADVQRPLDKVGKILDEIYALFQDEEITGTARGLFEESNLTIRRVREVSLPKLESLAGKIEGTIDRLGGKLGTTVGDLSARVDDTLADVRTLTKELTARSRETKPVVAKVGKTLDGLNQAITDARTLVADLRRTVKQTDANLGRVTDGVVKVTDGVDRVLTDNNRNLFVMIRKLRDTATVLERVARKVQGNPSVLFWGDDEAVPPTVSTPDDDLRRDTGRAKRYGKEPGR